MIATLPMRIEDLRSRSDGRTEILVVMECDGEREDLLRELGTLHILQHKHLVSVTFADRGCCEIDEIDEAGCCEVEEAG